MRTSVRTLLLLGAVAGAAVPAGAEELAGLTWHGFLSQGYVKTTDNNLYFAHTTRGTFEITEAALSFSTEPVSRLRIGAQLFAQDLGSEGNHRVIVDWAVGDYRVRDWFGVRGGKLKMPLGLYGTLRDADLGRPEIFQPESIYSDLLKNLVRSFDGVAVYGSVPLGSAGYFDYEAFGGNVDAGEKSTAAQRLADGAATAIAQGLAAGGLQRVRVSSEQVAGTMKHMYGGALEYRPPVQGLRLRFSGWKHDSELDSRTTVSGFLGPLPATFVIDVNSDVAHEAWVVASAEYQRGGLRVSAEHSWERIRTTVALDGLPTGPVAGTPTFSRPAGWYVQVAQRVGERLQLSAYHSRRYNEREDKEGLRLVAAGGEAFERWDKDFAGSARLDLANHFLLKAEVHRIDGAARVAATENPQGLTQTWYLLVAKGTVHF
jgi:hypothetical protein